MQHEWQWVVVALGIMATLYAMIQNVLRRKPLDSCVKAFGTMEDRDKSHSGEIKIMSERIAKQEAIAAFVAEEIKSINNRIDIMMKDIKDLLSISGNKRKYSGD